MSQWIANDEGLTGTSPMVLPRLCVKCGRPSDGGTRYDVELAWTPGWIWIGLLWGIIPAILLYYASVQRVQVKYSLCAEHLAVLRRRKYVAAGLVAAFVIMIAGAIVFRSFVVALVGAAFLVAALITYSLLRPPLYAGGYEKGVFAIKGFGPRFLERIAGPRRRSSDYDW